MVIDVKLALFYIFSSMVITSSFSVILSKNPVKAVLSLVFAFVASSGLWLLANAEFLALALIVVYVGAVMVLFLFVVMMLNVNVSTVHAGFIKYFPIATILACGFFATITYVFYGNFSFNNYPLPAEKAADYSNIKSLGLELYSNYIYNFELAGALLTVAIIAAIALTYRGPKHRHNQIINEQVKVTKKDRLKIIKM